MLKFYNTLTRTKQDFEPPQQGRNDVLMRPYRVQLRHIGNLRTYIFMDLVPAPCAEGYKLKGVLNITDVGHLMADSDDGEDKMVQASRAEKKSPWEIAEYYTKVFFEDLGKLNIGRPEIIAKATDHINDMIKYVEALLEAGYAYETSDGIYFDIQKFEGYGLKLSGAKLDEQIAGARVEVNSEKRHPADFALLEKGRPLHIMQWDSPWGKGYPAGTSSARL